MIAIAGNPDSVSYGNTHHYRTLNTILLKELIYKMYKLQELTKILVEISKYVHNFTLVVN